MKQTIETIKISKDGCKLMSYNGTKFWVNPYGKISQTDNWNVVSELEKAGLVTRKFYKNCYGHTEYKIK